MTGFIKNTVAKRLEGDPLVVRALLVAIVVGIGAAVLAYKLMRMRS
jgi:phage shock protein PspC (stress-responsive transcriptional regulator)